MGGKSVRDPRFDGHRDFELRSLSTVDKRLYMSMQIEQRHYIRIHVGRVDAPAWIPANWTRLPDSIVSCGV